MNKDKSLSINLFSVPYNVFPLRFFIQDYSRFQLILRYVGFFLILYVPGMIVTYFSGTFHMYISDVYHFLWDLTACIVLVLLVDLCKQITNRIDQLNLDNDFRESALGANIEKWNNTSFWWYTFCIFAPLVYVIGSLFLNFINFQIYGPFPMWADIQYVSLDTLRINSVYLLLELTLVNSLWGLGINRFIHYLRFIHDYGKNVLSTASVDMLSPEPLMKIKPFQQLIVKSTFFMSVPLFVCSIMFFEFYLRKGVFSFSWSLGLVGIICFFIISFINQLRWVRTILINSKTIAFSIIDKRILKVRDSIHTTDSSFIMLVNLHTFRKEIRKTSSWAIDFELFSRSSIAFFLPLFIGAIIQIFLERFMSPLIP